MESSAKMSTKAVQVGMPAARRRCGWFVALCLAVAMANGCGKAGTRVGGGVTLDGKPVEGAVVQFFPERSEAARTAATVTDAMGRFDVAVSPVAYRVTVVAERTVGQKQDDANPNSKLDVREVITPARYRDAKTSPLTVEAIDGKTTVVDFRLTTDEK